jgi:hypothetical protein
MSGKAGTSDRKAGEVAGRELKSLPAEETQRRGGQVHPVVEASTENG